MTLPELLYRLGSIFRSVVARVWPEGARSADQFSVLTSLLRPDVRQLPVPPCERRLDEDARLLAGEVSVFGRWFPVVPAGEFWHRDPVSGALWPRDTSGKIDYRPGNPTGDVRIVWELNRLQHLVGLAVIANEDEARRSAAVSLIESHIADWSAANPPGIGVNLVSGMEIALRLMAVLHAYDLVRQWVSESTRLEVARFAAFHANAIPSRLSLYSSAGNHTIAEAVGLLYAGTLLQESPSAALWRRTALQLLRQEVPRQIDADGGGVEQATWYLLFIVDLLGLAQALLRFSGQPPESTLDAALDRGRKFLNVLASGPDDLPMIGDGDDGFALARGLRISWTNRVQGVTACTFRDAGLSLVAESAGDRLLFLHKPLGMPPNFAHGHADCLSVLFKWAGRDVLIDPGTYQYGGDANLRRYFRSTGAHNTLLLDQADQAEQVAPFMWRHPFAAELVISRFERGATCLLASHDGYLGLDSRHWRGVVYQHGQFLAIWDYLSGNGDRDVAIHWNLGCPLESRDLESRKVEIRLDAEATIGLEVSGGSVQPQTGWRSRSYCSLEPSDVLEIRPDRVGGLPIVTVLWLAGERDWASVWPLFDPFQRHLPELRSS